MNSPISREELDAKLAAISGVSDERWLYFRQVTSDIQASVRKLHTTVILTGISSVLSVLLGVGAINASLLSGIVGAFESGHTAGRQLEAINTNLHALERRMDKLEADAAERDARLRADMRAEMDANRQALEQSIDRLATQIANKR